ncbi:25S rRNA (adenine2142-N1)-methyltransferase [Coemansia brasiliensis]|uniref:25S rRNA adenine-N(1) methyltransferase n=1 Tax=Coemansia brasiliensis TaxID=2650707 RepID=A0A9W8I7S9_9FUNG|nr:25S rRNA (adenine2142-N1)-methyltransferase [Coemansia brasiliensis]
MPKAHLKRRKRPVTAQPKASVPLPPIHISGHAKVIINTSTLSKAPLAKLGKSSTDTRRRINRFHTLIKEYSKLASQRPQLTDPEKLKEIDLQCDSISQEMAQMGGLDWYQKASLLGQSKQRGGDSSRWLIPKLQELQLHQRTSRLRLLDVGALSCRNYAREKWIDPLPIDLNSQEPGIVQQDFLEIPLANFTSEKHKLFEKPFDVVCLSLVVNFIGDPVKRGDMLRKAAQLLAPQGYLFLVLPLACITNSRYMNDERLLDITKYLGFTQLFSHHTAKLAYYLYQLSRSPPQVSDGPAQFGKTLLHKGAKRNNFTIVV